MRREHEYARGERGASAGEAEPAGGQEREDQRSRGLQPARIGPSGA